MAIETAKSLVYSGSGATTKPGQFQPLAETESRPKEATERSCYVHAIKTCC